MQFEADAMFDSMDVDGDGEISATEMKKYLSQYRYTESAVEKIYAALDMDKCGVINLAEFLDFYKDVSPAIMADNVFENMVKNTWGL